MASTGTYLRLTTFLKLSMPVALLLAGGYALAQDASSAPAADQAPAASVAQAPAAVQAKPEAAEPKAKGKKDVYTGPTEIIVLPQTPMLDEEGKQRLDPDGKPMFNPPVKQQRDKHGHPLFDENGKPVFQTAKELGYDEHGKKLRAEKEKPPKTVPVSIVAGTYTVDGVIGKAELNYDIADLKYIYLYAPGIGITVISNEPFPGAKEQPNAFNAKTLTVLVGDHMLQVASDKPLLKEKKPVSAFVLVDREFKLPSKYPVMGYGDVRRAPYAWPGSKDVKVDTGAVIPPPVPANLRPVTLLSPCPTGQMRMPAPKVLPGEVAPPQPCVPIAKAMAARAEAAKTNPSAISTPATEPAPAQPAGDAAPAATPK